MATTSTQENKVYDQWAAVLNYKKQITTLCRPCVSSSWIPEDQLRRIKAYDILAAYYECYSRDFRLAPEGGSTGNNDDIKEVGSPAWLCDKIKNKLLGGNVSVNIPTPKRLANLDAQIETLLKIEKPEADQKTRLTLLQARKGEKDLIAEREAYLQDWFAENMIALKIFENEELASYLGDCVYLVYWDEQESCPAIETYDPGFVFPEYDMENGRSLEDGETEVSDRVFIGWEEEIDDQENFRVYRETYELRVGQSGEKRCFRHAAYYNYGAGCDLELSELGTEQIIGDTEEKWADLEIDFIPIVIVPNIEVQGSVFGRSNIAKLLPLFDSTMNSETDLASNSEHLGGASVFLSGSEAKARKDSSGNPVSVKIKSNSVYFLGDSGRMDMLDTATMQDALLKTLERYDDKLIELSEITNIVAGRVDMAQIPSGVALKILLQPLLDKIEPMRQIRQLHYSMMFYYVQVFYRLKGSAEEKALFSDKVKLYDVYLQYGEIIPSDKSAQTKEYKEEMEILDERTVLEEMKADGRPIDVDVVMARKAETRKQQAEMNRSIFENQLGIDTGAGGAGGKGGGEGGAGGQGGEQ